MNDPRRGVYCNRTLNLHSIRAIGYDMDYTLIHYNMEVWERHAYGYLKEGLLARGWPVEDLEFDPGRVRRGLIIDRLLGNVVKANRFGFIKRAQHGNRFLSFEEQKEIYSRVGVDLRESRWRFLNTLFSISEGCMYSQLVELCDRGLLGAVGYREIHDVIRNTLDEAHGEGRLKGEIIEAPERYVELDEQVPLSLLEQKEAGKQLVLITNSEWSYAEPMLSFAFDRFLPGNMTWRNLFDLAIVGARKPSFFLEQAPAFQVVSDDGLLRESSGPLQLGKIYVGGNARLVEQALNLPGDEILYVGDHLFVDVNISKNVARWRTALILRELEEEIDAQRAFAEQQQQLTRLMQNKEALEQELATVRLQRQQLRHGRLTKQKINAKDLESRYKSLKEQLSQLDREVAPLAKASSELSHPEWGLLMRTGNDKSHLARQVERYADVYTSRVANFRAYTPFAYFRSHRGSLPHDSFS